MTNLSGGFQRISKGYVAVPNETGERLKYYAEVWLDVFTLNLQIRIFRKGASLRYSSDKNNVPWTMANKYIWLTVRIVMDRNPFYNINDFVQDVINKTGIVLFNESRKFLTDKEKQLFDFVYCADWTYEDCLKFKPSIKEIGKETFERIMNEKCQELDNFIKTKQMYTELMVRTIIKKALTSNKSFIAVR